MDSDPLKTQRDADSTVVAELCAAGFDDAVEVGRGGFGIVYKCRQIELDRIVAIKVLTAHLDEDRDRFLREQRAMGRLTGHPNIVGVLQVGETESGCPYLVMQYHRRGSIEADIRRRGGLPLREVLRLGVKMAGALETAHLAGILHRDVKPGNILVTDFGEPALCDFGIAHFKGAFTTSTGVFTGSPAFTAPEILAGKPASRSSDVYGLGATLFAALTGHAAFERRSGEQLIAQFLRIAGESAPNLRDSNIPDDVASAVERAMSPDPDLRPSTVAFAEQLRRLQAAHGFTVDEMALNAVDSDDEPEQARLAGPRSPSTRGSLPLELTSFVGRQTELDTVRQMLTSSRLVTLTGPGGVGKTRLALRAAAEVRGIFVDGVRLVELGALRDGSLVADVVAGVLGVRDDGGRPLLDVLVEAFYTRELLLVLDNCEQVVDESAKLVESLLRGCPGLHILATSREGLGIGGEAVLRVTPLEAGAIALFVDRAVAAVPGFELDDQNTEAVSKICARLDNLPLAIELAAARMKTMSLDQILDRLADRYSLLTRGQRGAPARQQTLGWSVGWSYDLCTPAEQLMWRQLSVFSGSFDLEAAEDICGEDVDAADVLDLISALLDKSILTRKDTSDTVRFRLLETLRDYGRGRIEQDEDLTRLRRRHAQWYRRLVSDGAAGFFGPQQLDWMRRLDREGSNIRAALEFTLSDSPAVMLEIAANLQPFGLARGILSEARVWLDRGLAAAPSEPTITRIRALYSAIMLAALQGDVTSGAARLSEAQDLAAQMNEPDVAGAVGIGAGILALVSGEFDSAAVVLEDIVDAVEDRILQVTAMLLLGWALEFGGKMGAALVWEERALAVAESSGESVYRGYALWSLGVGRWRHGERDRAEELLQEALRTTKAANDRRQAAACLEALAWIAGARDDHRRAAVLFAAATALGRTVGTVSTVVLPHLQVFHDDCERGIQDVLDSDERESAQRQGGAMDFAAAVAYATAATD